MQFCATPQFIMWNIGYKCVQSAQKMSKLFSMSATFGRKPKFTYRQVVWWYFNLSLGKTFHQLSVSPDTGDTFTFYRFEFLAAATAVAFWSPSNSLLVIQLWLQCTSRFEKRPTAPHRISPQPFKRNRNKPVPQEQRTSQTSLHLTALLKSMRPQSRLSSHHRNRKTQQKTGFTERQFLSDISTLHYTLHAWDKHSVCMSNATVCKTNKRTGPFTVRGGEPVFNCDPMRSTNSSSGIRRAVKTSNKHHRYSQSADHHGQHNITTLTLICLSVTGITTPPESLL